MTVVMLRRAKAPMLRRPTKARKVLRSLLALLGSSLVKFDVSTTEGSRSANQLGQRRFPTRLSPPTGSTYLVTRSLNRWCDKTLEQPYAVAISLRRNADRPEIYVELANQFVAIVEVELEAQAEL